MSISQTRNGTFFVHGAAKCHSNKYSSLGCVSEAEMLHVDRALDVIVQGAVVPTASPPISIHTPLES